MGFRDTDTKCAEISHFFDNFIGDKRIIQMPLMGVRNDAVLGEAAILVFDGVQRLVIEII